MQNGNAILAIDQGTSSSRALLFSQSGEILACAQQEIHCHYGADGVVEQDAEHIWQSVLTVSQEVMAQAKQRHLEVRGVAITNQRETTVLWRRDNGQVVAPAIVWQDRRTEAQCSALKAQGLEAWVQQKTGLLLDPYFSATKLQYVLQDTELRRAAEAGELAFGTVDSFLLWRLTGGLQATNALHATDTTNASRTLLFNITTLKWDAELLRLFTIPAAVLPQVKQSADNYGQVHADWGVLANVPIVALCGDQQAAAIGQGCVQAGSVKSTYGTGCFALLNTGNALLYSQQKLLSTIACTVHGQTRYALEGSIFVAGAAVKWLRDKLGVIEKAADTERLAQSVPDNAGVYLVPAFTGLGAPHWRADVKAQFSGLTLNTAKAHLVRATLEAVVYQTADLLAAMQQDGAQVRQLQVDGGMVANQWFCQFLADVLQIPVVRPMQIETTAYGAALLGGLQLGWYADLAALSAIVKADCRFEPKLAKAQRDSLLNGWQQAVQSVLCSHDARAS